MERLVFLAFLVASTAGGLLDDLPRQRRNSDQRTVSIRDLTKRSPEPYPNVLRIRVHTADGETDTYVVTRNLHPNDDVTVETSENGVKKRHVFDESGEAEYLSERAALHVRSEKANGEYERSITGFLYKRSDTYLVERDASGEHVLTKIETPPIVENRIKVGDELHDVLEPPTNSERSGFSAGRRYARGLTLYPDILMVTDVAIYTKMEEKYKAMGLSVSERERRTVRRIKDYYSLLGAGVAHKYEQVNYRGMTIKPRVAGILILKTVQDDEKVLGRHKDGENDIHDHEALVHQSAWFKGQRKEGHYKDIDHCMSFTGRRLYRLEEGGKRKYTEGLAFGNQICGFSGMSIVKEDFSMHAVGTAAHELGHSIGAPHDKDDCFDAYIMTPWLTDGNDENFGNVYKFSSCSLAGIYSNVERLNRYGANCMTDKPELDPETQRLQNRRPGRMFTKDQQCQMFTGRADARYCGSGDECRDLPCTGDSHCFSIDRNHALYGTPCGGNKECRYGVCEPVV